MMNDAFFEQLGVCDNDQEILLKFIKLIAPTTDEGAFTHALDSQFGGIMGLFAASYTKLARNNAVGENLAAIIKYTQLILMRTMKMKIRNRDLISNMSQLNEYLLFRNHSYPLERLEIFLMNSKNFLLKEEIVSSGTTNGILFHPTSIIKHIVDNNASSFILVHNHPSGDPSPSPEDIYQTRELNNICRMLSITFHDHIIVGDSITYSMRFHGIIE